MSAEAASESPKLPDDLTLLNRIRAFVADAADCPIDSVGPDDDLYLELKVDSLGAAAIFIDIAYEFRIPEPTEVASFALLNTPSKIVVYVKAASAGAWYSEPSFPLDFPEDPSTILPYGDQFRFVDLIVSAELNRIVTSTAWNAENLLVAAHFRDGPHVVPGVLLAEQAAQSALLLANLRGLAAPGEAMFLAQLRCDFRAAAVPPLTILTTVDFRATALGHFGFMATCSSGDLELARIKGIAAKKPDASAR
jgi:acyl carrier protein/3-hydroxymyristoyl/3-hydroxydecanoyl-(acyl carrier protein) dehydratase